MVAKNEFVKILITFLVVYLYLNKAKKETSDLTKTRL